MNNREQLVAYLATLAALVIVFIAALVAAGRGVTVGEAFGLGTITGGLIGLMRIPSSPQQRGPTGAPEDPLHTKEENP